MCFIWYGQTFTKPKDIYLCRVLFISLNEAKAAKGMYGPDLPILNYLRIVTDMVLFSRYRCSTLTGKREWPYGGQE